jgi:hypothetical protein
MGLPVWAEQVIGVSLVGVIDVGAVVARVADEISVAVGRQERAARGRLIDAWGDVVIAGTVKHDFRLRGTRVAVLEVVDAVLTGVGILLEWTQDLVAVYVGGLRLG